jgi:predicted TIM-barrel fold metal-dependent hydrolase
MSTTLINSADSHVMEPKDLWLRKLPPKLAELGPRSVTEGDREIVYVDGKVIRRDPLAFIESLRPPGAYDPKARLADLDDQGVWSEVIFPSLGLWCTLIDDPELALASSQVYNDYLAEEFMSVSDRFVGVPIVPVVDVDGAVGEVKRVAEMGYRTVGLQAAAPAGRPYNMPEYDPLWSTIADVGLPISMHVSTGSDPITNRGPGAALINYLECRLPPFSTLSQLIGAGVLERHPDLHVVFTEGGGTWLAAAVEMLDEGFHYTHPHYVRPKLSMPPSDFVRRQVHVTFQHDKSVMKLTDVIGVDALMFGTDYPHLEGTWPDTQKVVDELFGDVPAPVREAVTFGNLTRVYGLPTP